MSEYLLPIFFVVIMLVATIKKVRVYDCFLDGAKDGLRLSLDVFPYIATIFVCIELFKASGLNVIISNWLAPPLSCIGIPSQITEILLLVPLSGNGTIALLEGIIADYGVDSYVAKCAAVIAGGSETIFYISAVYFSQCKAKRLRYAIPVSLFCTLAGAILACALCRIM